MKVWMLKTTLQVKSEQKSSLGFLKHCVPLKMMMIMNKTELMMPLLNVWRQSLRMTLMSSKLWFWTLHQTPLNTKIGNTDKPVSEHSALSLLVWVNNANNNLLTLHCWNLLHFWKIVQSESNTLLSSLSTWSLNNAQKVSYTIKTSSIF